MLPSLFIYLFFSLSLSVYLCLFSLFVTSSGFSSVLLLHFHCYNFNCNNVPVTRLM